MSAPNHWERSWEKSHYNRSDVDQYGCYIPYECYACDPGSWDEAGTACAKHRDGLPVSEGDAGPLDLDVTP